MVHLSLDILNLVVIHGDKTPASSCEEWKVLKERFFAGEPVDPVFEVLFVPLQAATEWLASGKHTTHYGKSFFSWENSL